MPPERSLREVAGELIGHPLERLFFKWHYKAALTSAVARGALFLATNASAGWTAAVTASAVEFAFRFVTSGFYGAITQALRTVHPPRTGTIAALVGLPLAAHTLELALHWSRGTANLALSIGVSMAFTCLSTAFNLYAMRRGILIVGDDDRQSLLADLRRMPVVIASFVQALLRQVRLARTAARL